MQSYKLKGNPEYHQRAGSSCMGDQCKARQFRHATQCECSIYIAFQLPTPVHSACWRHLEVQTNPLDNPVTHNHRIQFFLTLQTQPTFLSHFLSSFRHFSTPTAIWLAVRQPSHLPRQRINAAPSSDDRHENSPA